jgi:hypothetical protein
VIQSQSEHTYTTNIKRAIAINDFLTPFLSTLQVEDTIMKKIFLIATATFYSLVATSQAYKSSSIKSHTDKLNEQYCSGLFKTAPGTILDLTGDNISALGHLNILDWMQGRVAGLQVFTSRTGSRIPYIRGARARIFIDEMPTDAWMLNALPVHDIAVVKVIKGPFAGDIGFGSGDVIAVYTFRGDDEEEE